MNEEILWELVAKELAGDKAAEKELAMLRLHDPEIDKAIKEAHVIWEKSSMLPNKAADLDIEHTLADLNAQVDMLEQVPQTDNASSKEVKLKPVYGGVYTKVAASVALLLAATLLWFNFPNNPFQQVSRQTLNGEHKQITLPDGSIVYLNVASLLSYPASFTTDERRVKLTGEAFFEVASNPEKPFIIETANTLTKVVGTSFNLRAYPDGSREEIGLKEGKVLFSDKLGEQEIDLVAGDFGVYEGESKQLVVNTISLNEIAPWTNNILKFQNSQLNEVVVDLERWYDVRIDVENKALLEKHFTGKFEEQSVEQVLTKIAMVLEAEFIKVDSKNFSIK